MPKISSKLLEEISLQLNINQQSIEEQHLEINRLQRNQIIPLSAYSQILSSSLSNGEPIEFYNDTINGKPAAFFEEYLRENEDMFENIDIDKGMFSPEEAKKIIEIVNEELDVKKSELKRINRRIENMGSQKDKYMVQYIMETVGEEALQLDPQELSTVLENQNREMRESGFPQAPFKVDVQSVRDLQSNVNTLNFYKALLNTGRDNKAIEQLQNLGVDRKFSEPLENLNKMSQKNALDDSDKLIIQEYMGKLGDGLTNRNYADVEAEVDKKTKMKIIDLQNNVRDLKDNFQGLEGFEDIIETIRTFEEIINEKPSDISEKIVLLAELDSSLTVSNILIDDAKENNEISRNFSIPSKHKFVQKVQAEIQVANLVQDLSDDDLIKNMSIYSKILEKTLNNPEIKNHTAIYEDYLIADLNEIVFEVVDDKNLYKDLDDYEKVTNIIKSENPELSSIDNKYIYESITNVNNLEFLNQRNSQYKNFNDIVNAFSTVEGIESLSENNKQKIEEINNLFKNSTTDELEDVYKKVVNELNSPEFTEIKLGFNNSIGNTSIKALELTGEQTTKSIELEVDSQLGLRDLEGITSISKPTSGEEKINNISDIIFYQLGSKEEFLNNFKDIVNNRDEGYVPHTNEAFAKALELTVPSVYEKIVAEVSIDDLITNFNSIGFGTYKLNQEDINIYKFLEKETRNEDFLEKYNTLLSNNPNLTNNEALFETFSIVNPTLLKKLKIYSLEDFKNVFPNNYNFDYFRNMARSASEYRVENEKELIEKFNMLIEQPAFLMLKDEFIEKYPEEFKNNNYNNKVFAIYKMLKSDDEDFKKEISEIKEGLDIEESSLLDSLNIKNETDFYYFYINDKDLNLDVISIKQNEVETLNDFQVYQKFANKISASIENGSVSADSVDMEQINNAISSMKQSNINMSKEKLKEMFMSLIENDEKNNISMFQEFLEIKSQYDKTNSFIDEVKMSTVSPRRAFGINNEFIKLSFDEDNNQFLEEIRKLEEDFYNIDVFNDNAAEEMNAVEVSANYIKVKSNCQFLYENLDYILKNSENPDFKNSFIASFKGNEEDAELYFNKKIEEYQLLFQKLNANMDSQDKIKDLIDEISEIDEMLSNDKISGNDLVLLSKKRNELVQEELELRINYEKFMDFVFTPNRLHDIYRFQKKTNEANRLQNNLFNPHSQMLHSLSEFKEEQENQIKAFSQLSEFLKYENLSPEHFNLKIKELLDELVYAELFYEEEANLFLSELTKKRDPEALDALKKSMIEYNKELEKRAYFVDNLLEHLTNEEITSDDFIKNMRNELSDNEILGILSILKNKKVIVDRAFKEALSLFDLDGDTNFTVNEEPSFEEQQKIDNMNPEERKSKESIEIDIQGVPARNGQDMKWGSASKVLFEEPYSNLLNDFKAFLQDIDPTILEKLENEKIERFDDIIKISDNSKTSMEELLRKFVSDKIMSEYPNHNFSDAEIEKMLFGAESSNFFFHTQMKKTLFTLKDGFKNDLLQYAKKEQIKKLSDEIGDLVTVESSNFHKFKELTEESLEEEKKLKEAEVELKKSQTIKSTLINSLQMKGVSEAEIENAPEIMGLKKDIARLNADINSHNNKINELNKNKDNATATMDGANDSLIQKRKLLSQMNTSSEESERVKNLTLAQRLYMFGDNNRFSNDEIINMSPDDMRNQYLADKDTLPLTEAERLAIIQKEEEEDKIAKSILDEIREQKEALKRKTPFINPLSTLNRNMEYLGYRNDGLRFGLYDAKIGTSFVGKFMWKSTKPLFAAIGKDIIKSAYWGHSKNAESAMGKITGLDLSTRTPSVKSALLFVKQRISFEEERAELAKKKSDAPKLVEENLEKILEQIKYSKTPNAEFVKVMENPLINDIMNPKKRAKFEGVNINDKVLDNFRESMYKQMKQNLTYNINAKDQKEAIFKLLKTMNPSDESIRAMLNDKFIDFGEKGIKSASSEEYTKLINIMKGGSSKVKKGKFQNEEPVGQDSSYVMFKKYLRGYIGEKIENDIGVKKYDLYQKTVDFQEKLHSFSQNFDRKNPIFATFHINSLKFNEVFEEHDPDNHGVFKDPLKASKDAHTVLVNMFEELSEKILEELRKDPKNEAMAKLLKDVLDFKVNIGDFKKTISMAEKIIIQSEFLLDEQNNEKQRKDNIDALNENSKTLENEKNKVSAELVSEYERLYSNILDNDSQIQQLITKFVHEKPPKTLSLNETGEIENMKSFEIARNYMDEMKQYLIKQGANQGEINKLFEKPASLFDSYQKINDDLVSVNADLNNEHSLLSNNFSADDLKNIKVTDIEKLYLDRQFVTGEMRRRLDAGDKIEDIENDYLNGKYKNPKNSISNMNNKDNSIDLKIKNIHIPNIDNTNIIKTLSLLKEDIDSIKKANNGKIELDEEAKKQVNDLRDAIRNVLKNGKEQTFIEPLEKFLDSLLYGKADLRDIMNFKDMIQRLKQIIKLPKDVERTSLEKPDLPQKEENSKVQEDEKGKYVLEDESRQKQGIKKATDTVISWTLKMPAGKFRDNIQAGLRAYRNNEMQQVGMDEAQLEELRKNQTTSERFAISPDSESTSKTKPKKVNKKSSNAMGQ